MSSNRQITDLAKQMAEAMQNLIEQGAQARVKELLDSVLTGGAVVPTARARTSVAAPSVATAGTKKKRNYVRKQCPVPNCTNLAAPRHSMVCTDHKDLTQREKDTYKAQAMAPGGRWYTESREKAHNKRKVAA